MALDEDINALNELIKILDEVHGAADPEAGLFLKTASEKITRLKSNAQDLLNDLQGTNTNQTNADGTTNVGSTLVYVSLFQSDPESIEKWQKTLRRISEYSLARPIYREVKHVEEMIRSRPDPRKEAYAEVTVKDEDIIKGYVGKKAQDQSGNEMLTVKEAAIKPENIKKFIHGEHRYTFKDDKLEPAE